MEGQHHSFFHQQPVRIVQPAVTTVYTPKTQRVEKRVFPLLKPHTHHGAVQKNHNFTILSKSKDLVQHCMLVLKRKQFIVGSGLFLAILLIVLLATGSFASKPTLPAIILEEDPYITQLLIENGSIDENIQSEEQENLPDIPVSVELTDYRVQRGDSLEKIARKFNVRIDTLISVNKIANVKQMQAGTILKIPNMDGIIHTVQKGDSLASIAKQYKTDVITLADVNNLASNTLQAKQTLFIPGARLPTETLKRALGTFIQWPIRGVLSSYFGYRANPFTGIRQFHNGIDIKANEGTAVKSAIDGIVAETGYSTVFGNFIIIKHSNSYQTLYGHLSKIFVSTGQKVSQSTVIGLTGNTGMTTGPHLHFSIFKNGVAINPLTVLGK